MAECLQQDAGSEGVVADRLEKGAPQQVCLPPPHHRYVIPVELCLHSVVAARLASAQAHVHELPTLHHLHISSSASDSLQQPPALMPSLQISASMIRMLLSRSRVPSREHHHSKALQCLVLLQVTWSAEACSSDFLVLSCWSFDHEASPLS
jgi:hypothetical protein